MNYTFIKDFFASYGLVSLIVAAVCSIISQILNKVLKGKYSTQLKTQLPFALAVIAHFVYDMIFASKAFVFTEKAFAAGILSGSLSIIINSLVSKIKRGEFIGLSTTALLIEGLLDGIVPETCLAATAVAVESIITDEANQKEKEQVIKEISEIVKINSGKQLTDAELIKTAEMILQAVSTL